MEGRIATGRQRLALAVDDAHEAVQAAHAALYEVQLAAERAENDALESGAFNHTNGVPIYARMRTEISELRPLLVPIARWLQAARKEVSTHGS